ncbi:SDR family oxidoreductase [Massilia niastensis]|uniref:SDR family oxidoreductase n=1 Tax=Massilia niastensis TaxID=544911 RepID=UPI00037A588F|nr:SDR family oxidoreductase [Massilia niastensis]
MGRLEGKRALVIGAAGRDNMAQTIARRFAEEGAQVMVAGRQLEELERFAHEIGGYAHQCDITRRQDTLDLARAAKERMGAIDIALNGTGWGLLKPFELTTPEELERITALQFIGPFYFFQAVLGAMEQGGSLIQISSATATIMLDDHAAYMGTKAGFDHVMRCIANQYGARGIRANSISPGLTDTPMGSRARAIPAVFETYQGCYPLGRVGTPGDIAAAAVWLGSDECFMTGQNLQVNGGLTLRRNPSAEELDAAAIRSTGKPRPRPWLT